MPTSRRGGDGTDQGDGSDADDGDSGGGDDADDADGSAAAGTTTTTEPPTTTTTEATTTTAAEDPVDGIRDAVIQALADAGIDGVEVDVDGDAVRLTGEVASDDDRQAAEEIAGGVADVGDVANEVSVVTETPPAEPTEGEPDFTG